jgi:hypothetical protein
MTGEPPRKDLHYTRTPLAKRLPVVGSLALAFVLATIVGHPLWLRVLVLFATLATCIVVLHFVFRQPIERLLAYQEFEDDQTGVRDT